LEDEGGPEISEIFGEGKGLPSKASPPTSQFGVVGLNCILEPTCLDSFIFAECPHPEVRCDRHRLERLADDEGERAYGSAEWRQMKKVDPEALVQMVQKVRGREHLAVH